MAFRIESIHAYISVGEDGEEGIIAAPLSPGLLSVPLIAADETRMTQLRPMAIAIGKSFGIEIKLIKFSAREEIETL